MIIVIVIVMVVVYGMVSYEMCWCYFILISTCFSPSFIEHISPLQLAQSIRDEIQSKTKCPASAGIGPNILLARMCTRVAKPNGQFQVEPQDVHKFISKC